MSSIARATSPEVPEPPAGTWSNCLVVNGVAYLAGMTARGSDGDEYAQAKTIFTKIRHLVEAAGGTMADIVKTNIYVLAEVEPGEIQKFRAVRDRYVNTAQPPASTFVVVSRLARPGWLIEIEAIAVI